MSTLVALSQDPILHFENDDGSPLVGGLLTTLVGGINFPTYSESTGNFALPNPIVLNSRGEVATAAGTSTPLYVSPNVAYTFILQRPDLTTVWTAPNIICAATSATVLITIQTLLTQAYLGNVLFPPTQAEIATNVTLATGYPYGNVLRYGLIPNNQSAAANNALFLSTLLNPTVAGPTGLVYFPNTTGSDIYYLYGTTQIRDGVTLDLNECTLNFTGAFNPSFNTQGFLTCIRDVTIQNGSITVNYNGTGGINNGAAIRLGSRSGYGFGTFPSGIFDQDNLVANGLPLQGGITIRNLRIKTNNPATHITFATGGLRNVIFENVWLDGGGVCLNNGFYYEYGWSSSNGGGPTSTWTSSHMTASHFRNIVVTNLATGGASQGVGTNGAYGCIFEGINVSVADQGLGFGAGESMFYRTWAQDGSTQRTMVLRNIRVSQCTIGVSMGGASPVGTGYLSTVINALPIPQQYQAQTDFLNFTLDGFQISTPSGTAIIATGAEVDIRNGACSNGGIAIGFECIRSTIENVQIANASGPHGIRFGFPTAIWSPARTIFTAIRTCKITGCSTFGISLGLCQSALIENNQIGANVLYDVANETVQTTGIGISNNSSGVRCRNNFITFAGGGQSYFNTTVTVDAKNTIENELNSQVTGGAGGWLTDFQSPSAQTLVNGNTIIVLNLRYVRLTEAGNVTGIIVAAGYASGQTVTLLNEANFTITFAASGTSRVAAGVSAVVAGLTKMILVWDSSTNLWY